MIMLKAIGVEPVPNHTRDVKQGWARWDAYVNVPDPDALAAEFTSRHVEFFRPLADDDDGLRGFELKDADGYVLFFGRLPSLSDTILIVAYSMASLALGFFVFERLRDTLAEAI